MLDSAFKKKKKKANTSVNKINVFRRGIKKLHARASNWNLYDVPMLEFSKHLHYPAFCCTDVGDWRKCADTSYTETGVLFLT